jgi:hypothetical protein
MAWGNFRKSVDIKVIFLIISKVRQQHASIVLVNSIGDLPPVGDLPTEYVSLRELLHEPVNILKKKNH